MNFNTPLTESDVEKHEKVVKSFISNDRKNAIKLELQSLVDDQLYELENWASDYIENAAADKAKRYLNRLIKGDEDAAKELFECGDGSRYASTGYNKGEAWAKVIHEKLYTSSSVELRKLIVEEFSDLLKTERIKDLESIVAGLEKQNKELIKKMDCGW